MVENISNFSSGIICTVIMTVIIGMILPEGKSKKYILFISGVVVTISMINPILDLFKIDINETLVSVEDEYKNYKYDESKYINSIQQTYNENLVNDIINRLKTNGYSVSNIDVEYDSNLNPEKVYLDLETEDGFVQPVKIEVSQSNKGKVSELTKNKIKNIINQNYGVNKDNIFIN